MHIFVGLWSKDTTVGRSAYRDRLNDLRTVASSFSKKMWTAWEKAIPEGPIQQDLLGIFVAPEYLMGRPKARDDDTFNSYLSVEERDIALEQLRNISDQFPSILFIPGTILWRKPVQRRERFDRRGSVLPPKAESRLQKATRLINEQLGWQENAVSESIQGKATLLSDAEGSKAKLRILNEEPGRLQYLLRNTCYVFFDGVNILKYHKMADYADIGFHEAITDDGTVFIPGQFWGRFQIDVLRFSLEVCFDHSQGYNLFYNGPQPDIQILTSAAVPTDNSRICIREGGIFLHASSAKAFTEIRNSKFEKIEFQERDFSSKGLLGTAFVEVADQAL